MRCLIFVTERLAGRGGVETLLDKAAHALARRGWTTEVALLDEPESPWVPASAMQVRTCGVKTNPGNIRRRLLRCIFYLRTVVAEADPDCIVITAPVGAALIRLAFPVRRRFRVLSWLHNDLALFHGLARLRWCDAHMSATQSAADVLTSLTGRPATMVGNPIDWPVPYIPRPAGGQPSEFVFIGRLAPEKRVDLLLSALANLQGDWRLQIVGDGPQLSSLRQQARAAGLTDRIVWWDWRPEPWEVVRHATALVLPSDTEGFGLVLAEAAARGVAVVSTDTTGAKEVVCGKNGWVVPRGDIRTLTTTLQHLVDRKHVLPPPSVVAASVERFASDAVMERFVAAMHACCAAAKGIHGRRGGGP